MERLLLTYFPRLMHYRIKIQTSSFRNSSQINVFELGKKHILFVIVIRNEENIDKIHPNVEKNLPRRKKKKPNDFVKIDWKHPSKNYVLKGRKKIRGRREKKILTYKFINHEMLLRL